MKEVKILGPGCAKCKATYQVIQKVINENNLDVKLTKIEDITAIMSYNVMGTPAVVMDEMVKIKGHVPTENEIKQLFGI
ncbi:MAG: thioredoxin family protein [Bacteroides sp.]|uniref:thioredoxin family protein n=1 Tax=Bacteroides sp. TaxID=29523 RepID=UPI0026E0E67F|nr:thioredoxin family protein [Bacteroides sp.]MDO5421142.1 thioredoxin family protein [Bacteroides sp.]